MAKTLLEKMFLKPEYALALLHLPEELQGELQTKNKRESILNGNYSFILTFYTKRADLEIEAPKLKEALTKGGLLWVAYPKDKALQTDLNRDILHTTLSKYSLDGVSLISLNNTWSAMRFKKL